MPPTCPSTCRAAAQDRCRWCDRSRGPRLPARKRPAPGSSRTSSARRSTAKREAGDRSRGPRRAVPLRRDRCRWSARPRGLDSGAGASGASIKVGEPGEALHREARGVRCWRRAPRRAVQPRQNRCGGAIGRDALDAATVASGASIKAASPARRSTTSRSMPATRPSTCPAASCPGGRGPMGCFGTGNKHYRSHIR